MKFIFVISILFTVSECLKCRSENDEKTVEEYEDIVRSCLRMEDDRQTNERWKGANRGGYRTQNGRGKYGNRDDEDAEDDDDYGRRKQNRKEQNKRGQSNTDLNNGRRKPQRDKQNDDDYDYEDSYSNNRKNRPNSSKDRNSQRGRDKNESRRGQSHEPGYNSDSGMHNYYNLGSHYNSSKRHSSPLDHVDACIIHCMFRQMKMVNENSMLDKSSVMSTLTRRIRDPELKEFIQDSVQECFENLERNGGQCETTKTFAICLEDKGRTNCEDWDLRQGGRRNKHEESYPFQNSRG